MAVKEEGFRCCGCKRGLTVNIQIKMMHGHQRAIVKEREKGERRVEREREGGGANPQIPDHPARQ